MSKMGFICCFVLLGCLNLKAATLYVDLGSTASATPYADWTSAATNIQDAVNVAVAGDTVMITNGHYLLDAEILVNKDITLRSVNGPDNTIVDGQGSVRCFNLGSAACLVDGLTITNGYNSSYGGGVYCSSFSPVVTNCIVRGNRANSYGGGIYKGTVKNCTISSNSAGRYGGGMYGGRAECCFISRNTAESRGGGMCEGTADSCLISGNTSEYSGGGIYHATANSCTIMGNSAERDGGGMYSGTANNCIIWNNAAPSGSDLRSATSRYSCSPDVTHGVNGNITNAPLLSASSKITSDSPCYGAGSRDYVGGKDIDGDAWLFPPSMGCDELELAVGNLSLEFGSSSSVVLQGGSLPMFVQIEGAASSLSWDYADATTDADRLSAEHVWNSPGDYNVIVTAYNSTWPDGVTVTQTVSVLTKEQATIHVAPTGNDANDGYSWATAKATIQAGVDAQIFDECSVLVSNGTYALTNEVLVNKAIVVRSVNGPESTIVDGQGVVRCFYLDNSACVIEGLTITNGYTTDYGL